MSLQAFLTVFLGSLFWGCHQENKTHKEEALLQDSASEGSSIVFQNIVAEVHTERGSLVTLHWTQTTAGSVQAQYSVDPDVWLSSPALDLEAGEHSQILLGIPYDTEVTYRLLWEDGPNSHTSEDAYIQTSPLPTGIPTPTDVSGDPNSWEPDMTYVLLSMEAAGASRGNFVFIIDRAGRVVWSQKLEAQRISLHARISHDGRDLLIDQNSFWAAWDDGAASEIWRMKIDGTIVETYPTPGLHHPFTDMEDGSIVWAAYQNNSNETIEKLTPAGEQISIFDCWSYIEQWDLEDAYCASNTLVWHPLRESFLLSLYSLEAVLEVDSNTGEVLRRFGHIPEAYTFEPAESAFYWQHGGYILESGNFLVSSRSKEPDETVIREYEIDDDSQALREVWSFGLGEGIYGRTMGEAHRLPSGNTLHNYGSATRLREVTMDGEVVWDIDWNGPLLGRSVPVSDLYALLP